jgi:hypothetical protein
MNSQTSKNFQEWTSERSVWIKQDSYIPRQFPSDTQDLSSTKDLRTRVIREVQVGDRWQRTGTECREVERFYLHPSFPEIGFIDLMIGGNHLVIAHGDGAVEIMKIECDVLTPVDNTIVFQQARPCHSTEAELYFNQGSVIPSSETCGHIFVELSHKTDFSK